MHNKFIIIKIYEKVIVDNYVLFEMDLLKMEYFLLFLPFIIIKIKIYENDTIQRSYC